MNKIGKVTIYLDDRREENLGELPLDVPEILRFALDDITRVLPHVPQIGETEEMGVFHLRLGEIKKRRGKIKFRHGKFIFCLLLKMMAYATAKFKVPPNTSQSPPPPCAGAYGGTCYTPSRPARP